MSESRPRPVSEQEQHLRGLSAEQRDQLMVQAAKLYYDLERTQSEIGRQLGLNRFQVARLLREARETGIIRVSITPRAQRLPELESRLQKRFGLVEAIVAGGVEGDAGTLFPVARAAATYLATVGERAGVIGVSWGRTMAAVADNLPQGWAPGAQLVLLNGATHVTSHAAPATAVAETMARLAPGRATMLPVPAIVGQAETREALVRDPLIAQVLALGAAAPVACFGLGGLGAGSVLVESGYFGPDKMLELRGRGAVGDILGRLVDENGAVVDEELDSRAIGLDLERLRAKELSIGVSAGKAKHGIVLAALRAGYINVLVTDQATAEHVLEEK